MTAIPVLTLMALLVFAPAAAGEEPAPADCDPGAIVSAGDLAIGGAFTRATLPNARSGGGFLTLTNNGSTADRLVAAETEAAAVVELHRMEMAGDMMRMSPVEGGIEIPAGGTIVLEPGGLHIMMMGIETPLSEGACVPVTLTFEQAGTVTVMLHVADPAARSTPGHHGH